MYVFRRGDQAEADESTELGRPHSTSPADQIETCVSDRIRMDLGFFADPDPDFKNQYFLPIRSGSGQKDQDPKHG